MEQTSSQLDGDSKIFSSNLTFKLWPLDEVRNEPNILYPDNDISPMKSSTLCLTNSSLNLNPSSLIILSLPKTIAFLRLPPKAKPFDLSLSTSSKKPKVLELQICD